MESLLLEQLREETKNLRRQDETILACASLVCLFGGENLIELARSAKGSVATLCDLLSAKLTKAKKEIVGFTFASLMDDDADIFLLVELFKAISSSECDVKEIVSSLELPARNGKRTARSFYSGTIPFITKNVWALANVHDDCSVIDVGCGSGIFLAQTVLAFSNVHVFGEESDMFCYNTARLRVAALGADPSGIQYNDAFVRPYFLQKEKFRTFDCVFTDVFSSDSNGDMYHFMNTAAQYAGDSGIAVALLPSALLFSSAYGEVRSSIVVSGNLRGVVMAQTNALFVLGKSNEKIRLCLTPDVPARVRRAQTINELSSYEPTLAHQFLSKRKDEHSVEVTCTQLKAQNYILDPNAYLAEKNAKAVPFAKKIDTVAEIRRGMQIVSIPEDASVPFDESNASQNAVLLKLSDISEDEITDSCADSDSSCIDISRYKKAEEYIVKENDVIISAISKRSPSVVLKSAIVGKCKNNFIVTSNLLLLRTNSEVLDPLFLKIFLDTKDGQNALSAFVMGSVMAALQPSRLKELLVPVPPLTVQHEVVAAWKKKKAELMLAEKKVRSLREDLGGVFDSIINK